MTYPPRAMRQDDTDSSDGDGALSAGSAADEIDDRVRQAWQTVQARHMARQASATATAPVFAASSSHDNAVQRDRDCEIFVLYLPNGCSKERVMHIFEPFGPIVNCKLLPCAKGMGEHKYRRAFVQLPTVERTAAAIRSLDGQQVMVDGSRFVLRVRRVTSTAPVAARHQLTVTNLSGQLTQEDLLAMLHRDWTVSELDMRKDPEVPFTLCVNSVLTLTLLLLLDQSPSHKVAKVASSSSVDRTSAVTDTLRAQIRFDTVSHALEALEALNQKSIGGDTLYAFFADEVADASAYVHIVPRSANRLAPVAPEHQQNTSRTEQEKYDNETNMYLVGLPLNITERQLRTELEKYGKVSSIKIWNNFKNLPYETAFADFVNPETAHQLFCSQLVIGEQHVTVRYADRNKRNKSPYVGSSRSRSVAKDGVAPSATSAQRQSDPSRRASTPDHLFLNNKNTWAATAAEMDRRMPTQFEQLTINGSTSDPESDSGVAVEDDSAAAPVSDTLPSAADIIARFQEFQLLAAQVTIDVSRVMTKYSTDPTLAAQLAMATSDWAQVSAATVKACNSLSTLPGNAIDFSVSAIPPSSSNASATAAVSAKTIVGDLVQDVELSAAAARLPRPAHLTIFDMSLEDLKAWQQFWCSLRFDVVAYLSQTVRGKELLARMQNAVFQYSICAMHLYVGLLCHMAEPQGKLYKEAASFTGADWTLLNKTKVQRNYYVHGNGGDIRLSKADFEGLVVIVGKHAEQLRCLLD
ncbi:hypothetical protein RI367_000474 [Sorochytrium milnesiophthora]